MDDGYVIPGLNEGWTLLGAKLMEWASGFVMAMLTQELLGVKMGTSGPLILIVALGTTLMMATARRAFPDEERGMRNACMVALGFEPPGIPAPAVFVPFWSGAPVRKLSERSYFERLELASLFDREADADPGSIYLQQPRRKGAKG